MTVFEFDKATIESFLAAFREQRPLSPPAAGWSIDALYMLTGVLRRAIAIKELPHKFDAQDGSVLDTPHTAMDESLAEEVERACICSLELAQLVVDCEYDNRWEEKGLMTIGYSDGSAAPEVLLVKGSKEPLAGFPG